MSHAQPHNTEVTRDAAGQDYITFEPYPGRVRGFVEGKVIVDSERAMLLREGRLPPVLYFPREDVRMDLFEPSERRTYCPYRGVPVYFHLDTGSRRLDDVAWSYEDPYPDAEYVSDYVAFDRSKIERWDESAAVPQTPEPAARHLNRLAEWLVFEGWQAVSLPDLVTRFVEAVQLAGIRMLRFALITRTLHPLIGGASYRWERGVDNITETTIRHEALSTSQYLDSPLVPIFEGAGGVRRRLEGDAGADDFPVLADIRAAGGTDYVAMPIEFSDGQVNAVTMATDQPGGFTTGQLGLVNEVMPLFSRLVEVFLQRDKSVTLLSTYLGRQTGKRVLEGRVRRGDGEDIHAVIWFCDLRRSSALAASMSRAAFLEHLNAFFDCMAGAVLDNGGEVLRFIGDAALAIFPMQVVEEGDEPACRRALAAAADAARRVDEHNRSEPGAGDAPMEFGIGLHIGDVTYGNIGTASRLEFTVIGSAANEAARIESLCKRLDHPVLLSEDFARLCPSDYVSLGHHSLAGTARSMEIFAPRSLSAAAASAGVDPAPTTT